MKLTCLLLQGLIADGNVKTRACFAGEAQHYNGARGQHDAADHDHVAAAAILRRYPDGSWLWCSGRLVLHGPCGQCSRMKSADQAETYVWTAVGWPGWQTRLARDSTEAVICALECQRSLWLWCAPGSLPVGQVSLDMHEHAVNSRPLVHNGCMRLLDEHPTPMLACNIPQSVSPWTLTCGGIGATCLTESVAT